MNTDDMASLIAFDQVVRSTLAVDAVPIVAVDEVGSFATVFFEEGRCLSPEVLWDGPKTSHGQQICRHSAIRWSSATRICDEGHPREQETRRRTGPSSNVIAKCPACLQRS